MATTVNVNIDLALAGRISMDAAERGVRAATLDGEALLKVILSQPGTGRTYGNHTASAPGAPPAPDTGNLRNRISTEVRRGPTEAVGEIAVNSEYAAALELGTEKIAPRPFASRMLRDHADRLLATFQRFARV